VFSARYATTAHVKRINPPKNKRKEKMGGRVFIYMGQNTNKWRALVNAKPSGFIQYVEFDLLRINLLA
jgi:hypothetical protein